MRKYNADNSIFIAQLYVDHMEQRSQTIQYCGVGVHFQNSISDNLIKILSGNARTVLLHANHLWPEACVPSLWLFVIKDAEHNRN